MNTVIDTSVIIVFSLFILVIGILFARTGRNLKSFFAGGEAVPWFIGGLSLFMSFFSAGTFVAWGSIAYKYGWVAITIQWTMCVGGLITGLYFAPKWKAAGNLTAAEFIKERLGDHVQKIYVGIFMAVSLFIKGSVLYSVARLVSSSLDYPLLPVTIVLGLLMISYTAVGGLWAVMVTDILQFVILTAAVLLIIPLAFDATGGVSAFLEKVPADFFRLVNGEFTWGFILAFAIYHVFYIGGNWTFVQRYTSVDSTRSASRVAFLFAGLYIISPMIWMLPPMIYHTIDPGLQGLDTENAYLMVCKYVLPAGLMGLMLTGMYFSTSASANTALNVVAAVFTNDIYKAKLRPAATEQQLVKVARISSWFFGGGMIGIALIVPYIGGIVEFTLSVASVTGGPLLAPPLWALFSKRLTGRATLFITLVSLGVNLFIKLLLPVLTGINLNRSEEMITGVGLPFLLLVIYELWAFQRKAGSPEYAAFIKQQEQRKASRQVIHEEEELALRQQNKFGLNVIAFSLAFISVMLYVLSLLAPGKWVAGIATLILLSSLIPLRAARRIKKKIIMNSVKIISPVIALLFLSHVSFAQKKTPPDYIVKVVSDQPDLLCHAGEKVTYTITVLFKGDTVREGRIRWRISKDGLEPPLQQGYADLENGYVTVSGALNEPGFLQCRADFSAPKPLKASTGRSGVAVDPLDIRPGLPPPEDFDEYWDKQKKILAAIPLNVRITKVKSPVEGVECFNVQADCLGAPMSAYMARPAGAAPKTLPATLLLHGAGVASSRLKVAAAWAKDGFIALDFNAHGLPNGLPQKYYSNLYKGPYKKYYLKNPVHRDSIFFRTLFIRLMRALDVLTIQPEWDGKRLVANGRSQGGGQAFAAAGLDERVTFFVAQIPAMCDHTGVAAGRINGWPKLVPFDPKTGKPDPVAVQAVRYFDGANFATRTKAGAFVTVGFIDVSCPPSSVYAAYNVLKGKKEIVNHYFTGHVASAEADSLVRVAVLKNVFGAKDEKDSLSAAIFRSPDNNQFKPLTWWHWINGNVTKEGIRKDLTDMKRVGIGGVQLFDTHMYLPRGPVRYGSKEWFDHVAFAIRVCDSLGLEFYTTNSPGWSGSGGPWITKEQSMKKLVFSERDITGGSLINIALPQPYAYEGFYRDVKLLALPAKGNEEEIRKQIKKVSTASGTRLSALVDGDYTTGHKYLISNNRGSSLLFEFTSAVAINMLTIDLELPRGLLRLAGTIEGSTDGTHYKQLAKFNFDNHENKSGNFPIPLTGGPAKFIRIVLSDSKTAGNVPLTLNEIVFRNLYQLKDWSRRTGMVKKPFLPATPADTDPSKAFRPTDIIDLEKYYDAKTNRLQWKAPPGQWTLLRFGYTSTGADVHPAVKEGSGLEADKLDTAVVKYQFEQSVGKIIRAAGPYTGKTFKGILFDSFEGGFQNWTGDMPALFSKLKGYDSDLLLPALAGRTVRSLRHTSHLLWDFQDALTKLFAANYYRVMQQLAHQHNLLLFAEGQGGPMSPAVVDVYADVPMNEFWTGGRVFARENQIRQTVSISNVLGKKLIGAESFTSRPEHGKWQNTPYILKRTGDYAFAFGINKFIFHTYTHQPYNNIAPGFTMGRYGAHFGRTNTWWKYAGDWMTYLTRSQYLLQKGRMIADICYLFPSDAIYEFPPHTKKPPRGYNFDIVYPDKLSLFQYRSGALLLPTGPQYKLMVLPEYRYMTFETLQQLYRLLREGAILSGPPPVGPPDLAGSEKLARYHELVKKIWGNLDGKNNRVAVRGKGKIYWGVPVEKIMQEIKLTPDLSFNNLNAKDTVVYIHRATGDADIYFISNQTGKALSFTATFRIKEKQPEFWDPVTGKVWPALLFDTLRHGTSVPVLLAPSGSIFMVFRKPLPSTWVRSVTTQKELASAGPDYIINYPDKLITSNNNSFRISYSDGKKKTVKTRPVRKGITVKGPWKVSFADGRGAPYSTIFPELVSWHTHKNKAIKYYSGTAIYTNSFKLRAKLKADEKCLLVLDGLHDVAEVFVNGKRAGVIWTKPLQADITSLLRKGKNELRIIVVNRWINRLIGDAFIPVDLKYDEAGTKFTNGRLLQWPNWFANPSVTRTDKRFTFTTWKHYGTNDPLVPSGLTGPVQLQFYRIISLTP